MWTRLGEAKVIVIRSEGERVGRTSMLVAARRQ
jgi:hypothetical protein